MFQIDANENQKILQGSTNIGWKSLCQKLY